MQSIATVPPELQLTEIQAALERCMKANPPVGAAHCLHPDADRIATLWATMHIGRVSVIGTQAISQDAQDALHRWL